MIKSVFTSLTLFALLSLPAVAAAQMDIPLGNAGVDGQTIYVCVNEGDCTLFFSQAKYTCDTHMIVDAGYDALAKAIAENNGKTAVSVLPGCYAAIAENAPEYVLLCEGTGVDGSYAVCSSVKQGKTYPVPRTRPAYLH